eukprot:7652508-Karenia_brevis.AAC.1
MFNDGKVASDNPQQSAAGERKPSKSSKRRQRKQRVAEAKDFVMRDDGETPVQDTPVLASPNL